MDRTITTLYQRVEAAGFLISRKDGQGDPDGSARALLHAAVGKLMDLEQMHFPDADSRAKAYEARSHEVVEAKMIMIFIKHDTLAHRIGPLDRYGYLVREHSQMHKLNDEFERLVKQDNPDDERINVLLDSLDVVAWHVEGSASREYIRLAQLEKATSTELEPAELSDIRDHIRRIRNFQSDAVAIINRITSKWRENVIDAIDDNVDRYSNIDETYAEGDRWI